jgi:hypothetical protein
MKYVLIAVVALMFSYVSNDDYIDAVQVAQYSDK